MKSRIKWSCAWAGFLSAGSILALLNSPSAYHWYMRNSGRYHYIACGGGSYIPIEEYRLARSSQITAMVARYNRFLPNGATPIELVDGAIYTPADLAGLVDAGYCADADLQNQMGGDWIWVAEKKRFEPEAR